MTATMTEQGLHECACGCGELIGPKSTWKKGHWARRNNPHIRPLPGPDDDIDDDDDGGELPSELIDELGQLPPDEEQPPPQDKPPGRLREPRAASGKGKAGKGPTAAQRRDVEAKIRFILKPGAEIWAMRDPFCGQVAIGQEPEVSSALADIVCDSADLLNWFTGPASGFMKYFKLVMALWPVGMAVQAHHLAHRVFPADPNQPPQQPAYAA